MREIVLLGTSGCHLCEVAEGVVGSALNHFPGKYRLLNVEIADSDELVERYGSLIPVLKTKSEQINTELRWPFSIDAVLEFLGENIEAKK